MSDTILNNSENVEKLKLKIIFLSFKGVSSFSSQFVKVSSKLVIIVGEEWYYTKKLKKLYMKTLL